MKHMHTRFNPASQWHHSLICNCVLHSKRTKPAASLAGAVGIGLLESLMLKILSMMKYVKPLSLFQGLLKIEPSKRRRLLGLDVGDKYVGLAISDPHNKVANPLSVLVRTKMNSELIATDFQSLISEYSLAAFVVGCPPSKTSAVQVKLFMDDLCKTGKLEGFEYTYWNEFNSSKIPELMLKPLKPHPVHAKTAIDKFAAIYILQGYLDYVNRSLIVKKC